MKLLYMYIKSFGDLFQDISFDFCHDFKINYEETNQSLTIERNLHDIDGFYGDVISDITAIVGKNGSGKTSILELIGRTMKDRLELANVVDRDLRDQYFMIFHVDNDTFYFEGIGSIKIGNISGYGSLLEGHHALARNFYFRKDDDVSFKIIESYGNNVRDRIIYIRDDVMMSSGNYLVYSNSSEVHFIPRVTGAYYSWLDWYQIYLDLYKKGMIQTSSVQIIFKTHNAIKHINEGFSIPSIEKDGNPTFNGMLFIIEEVMDDFFSRFMSVLVNYFINISKEVCFSDISGDWNELKKDYRDNVHSNLRDYQMIFERCIHINEKHELQSTEALLSREYMELARRLFDALYEAKERIIPGVDEFQLLVSGLEHDENIANVFRGYMELQEFVRYHFQSDPKNEDWNLTKKSKERYSGQQFSITMPFEVERIKISTGEKKLLELLGTIIYEVKTSTEIQPIRVFNKDIRKNHIILVDEIESAMHLEWSRNLLEYLTTYLQGLTLDFTGKEYKYTDLGIHVQLIVTTHSPFLLSDLRRNSIIALEAANGKVSKKGYIGAFAQNIQRVMSNEFFIKECYGAFAQRKIQDIINTCNEEHPLDAIEKKRIKLTLDEVGEPILRKKLEEKFIQKLKNDSNVQEEEMELVNKIRQLYGELSNEQVMNKLKIMLEEQGK